MRSVFSRIGILLMILFLSGRIEILYLFQFGALLFVFGDAIGYMITKLMELEDA